MRAVPRRREPGLIALVGFTALADTVASFIRHVHVQSGIDLAIFDQAVWHYSRFEAPVSSIRNQNLLGDHFHPLVAVLSPLYWIWSDPRMLLLAQSLLVAASIVPVFLFARPRIGRAGAYLLAGAYAAFWGLQVGVLFDFHEVAFAPLLIALAILFADRRRWGWLWSVVVLLLLVKEDLSILVVFLGIYLLTLREPRHGIALVVVGVVWYELATRVFIPHFAGGHSYAYWSYGELGVNPLAAVWALIHAPWRLFTIGFSPSEKASTIAELLGPFLLLSLWSRVFILAIPLLLERFLSTTPALWSTHYHYSLALAPVLAMGAAAGLGNVLAKLPERRRRPVVLAATTAMLVVSVVISRSNPDSAITALTRQAFYNPPSYAAGALSALRRVPPSASLATVDELLPHASQRPHAEQLQPRTLGIDQYLVINVLRLTCCGVAGNGTYEVLGRTVDAELGLLTPVYYNAGWLVGKRAAPGHPAGNGVIAPMSLRTALRVDPIAGRWQADHDAAGTGLVACYLSHATDRARAAACLRSVSTPLQARQVALATALRSALPGLQPACSGLADAALAATTQFTRDVGRLPEAASFGRAALTAAVTNVGRDIHDLDLRDQLTRFLILCTPQSAVPQLLDRASGTGSQSVPGLSAHKP
jgi:uncharacterized membrane protein